MARSSDQTTDQFPERAQNRTLKQVEGSRRDAVEANAAAGHPGQSSDVRSARIVELRKGIKEGKYSVPAEALAESLLKSMRRI